MSNASEAIQKDFSHNWWWWVGRRVITPIFAIGSSMTTTVAVAGISFIAGLALPYLIPLLLAVFLAEAFINIYIYKDSVPKTLVDLFAKSFFQDAEGKALSPAKKAWLSVGLFAALSGGAAVAALTYVSVIKAAAVGLALAGLSCPPLGIALGIILGVVAVISFTSLLTRWIKTAIEEDYHVKAITFFKDLLTRTNKPLVQEVLEKTFKILFTTGIILLTIIGTIATLGTIEKGLNAVLSLIPDANRLATKVASSIMTFALMGVARLPFVLTHVCKFFSRLGEYVGNSIYNVGCAVGKKCFGYVPPATPIINPKPTETKSKLSTIAKISALFVYSFSHGALAAADNRGSEIVGEILHNSGQDAVLASGAIMASGIGGHTLFQAKASVHLEDEKKVTVQRLARA